MGRTLRVRGYIGLNTDLIDVSIGVGITNSCTQNISSTGRWYFLILHVYIIWISFSAIRFWFYSILFYPITLEGRWGTTDEFATIPFHLDLLSAALGELAKSIPVHSLILSSHLFFCLPLFLFPFTVPCRIVCAKPEDLETWPNQLSFRFLTRVRSSSYSPMAAWIFLQILVALT